MYMNELLGGEDSLERDKLLKRNPFNDSLKGLSIYRSGAQICNHEKARQPRM